MINNKTLVIETLGLTYNSNYGYQEYLFNMLDYFYENRNLLKFNRIVVASRKENVIVFKKYSSEFEIEGFFCPNLFAKYMVLNTLYTSLHLNNKDVILFTNNYSSLIKRCKHILVVHDLIYLRKNYLPQFLFRLQRHLFIPRSIKIADKIIAISQWVKSDIETNFHIRNKERIVAIYNYFNFKKYEIGLIDPKIIALADSKKFFLVVSSNSLHKNTITVFKAFSEFCKKNDDMVNLICVGNISGHLRDFYDQSPSNIKDRMIVFQSISNASLGYLYKKTCGYISATLFEGLGMPIVEAMYFNAPVLVSDIEVVREVSLNKGLYFSPLDYLGLSSLMKRVFFEKKESDNHSIVKDMFSEYNTVGRYIKEINNINK